MNNTGGMVIEFLNQNEYENRYTKTKLRIEYVCKTMYHEIQFFISIENDKDYVFTTAYL